MPERFHCSYKELNFYFINVCQQIGDQCLFKFRIVQILINVCVALKSDILIKVSHHK